MPGIFKRKAVSEMIEIKTLEHITTGELLQAFNLSFSDYIVPLQLTQTQLEEKIINDRVDLSISVGAFEDGELIAFIIHGYDKYEEKMIAYNAGTGVVPAKRGQHLTIRLYQYILPILREKRVEKILLEVIDSNKPAIKTYQEIGFIVTRKLMCFNGRPGLPEKSNDFNITTLHNYDWDLLRSFWDWQPTWQNSITAVEKLADSNDAIGIFLQEVLIGYLVYNAKTKRVQQFAVHKNYRRKGIGTALFSFINSNDQKDVVIINVDHTAKDTLEFLNRLGMQNFVSQYEMELYLK